VGEAREDRRHATPGVLGYALAVGLSLIIFAVEISISDALQQGTLNNVLAVVVVIIVFGAVPAAIIGGAGACIVHLLTRRAASQGWALAGAALAGLVAGLLVYRDEILPAMLLSIATGAGRLAVVPWATHRRRTPV
jgi:uncharacterized membrane protein